MSFLRILDLLNPDMSSSTVYCCSVFFEGDKKGLSVIPEEVDIDKGKPDWCILKKHELVIQHSSK